MGGLTAMDLDLCEPALSAAIDFSAAFPWCVFTSGRRSLEEQASAMAKNVVLNRSWIRGGAHPTYKPSLCADACQAWVYAHPEAISQAQIAAGLLAIMSSFTDAEIGKMSKHPAGLAFDVAPVADPRGAAPKAWLRARAAKIGGRFLEQENGLVRWHFQAPSVDGCCEGICV